MPIELYAHEIPALITWFNSFLGFGEIQNRLNRVEMKLNSVTAFSPALTRRYEFHTTYQKLTKRARLNLRPDIEDLATNRALSFLASINTLSKSLSENDRHRLKSRLLDALSPDRDIRQLQHEARAYIHYLQAGCKVEWADSEKNRFDFLVEGPRGPFEVECKTFADNIGNPISLDDSFFIFETVRKAMERKGFPPSGIVTIKIPNRSALTHQSLSASFDDFLAKAPASCRYEQLSIECNRKMDWDILLQSGNRNSIIDEISSWQETQNRHCMAVITKRAAIIVSLSGGRPSKPYSAICESLKKASGQFSKERPAVVWGHFLGLGEYELRELLERQRMGVRTLDAFGHYLFKSENRNHVCRLRLSADGASVHKVAPDGRFQTPGHVSGHGPAYDLSSKISRFDSELTSEQA